MQRDKVHNKLVASSVSDLIKEFRKMRTAQNDFRKEKNTPNYKSMIAAEERVDDIISGTNLFLKNHPSKDVLFDDVGSTEEKPHHEEKAHKKLLEFE